MADLNPLAMTDEDFAKLAGPTDVEAEAKPDAADADKVETPAVVVEEETPTRQVEEQTEAEKAVTAEDGDDESEVKLGEDGKPIVETPAEPELDADGKPVEKKAEPAKADEDKAEKTAEDKPGETRVFQVPTSFKANGKTIELKTEAEALALMQMGANYTRKLQELQPSKKLLMMLENNGLLDEGKLSFLIDLEKKDPAAIKQLIKDSGIDVLDIDPSADPGYLPGSHQVTDEEANFRTAMADITSTPSGKETVTEIHGTWDDTSKEALWKSPEIMAVIHEQRESGAYAKITAEMDRQKTLGQIPANAPFLEAYKIAGDTLLGALGIKPDAEPAGEKTPLVPVTRAATPKPSTLANDDKASAASPTRAAPKAAKVISNPLAQSDEEFMKQFDGRL